MMRDLDIKDATVVKATGALLTILACLAALGTLSTNILLPSLPGIARALEVPIVSTGALMSWFFATFALGQLFVGPLSDRYGRRPIVVAGFAIFVAGSIVCAISTSLSGLVAGRIIQAIGVCAASVLSRAIARDLFTGNELARVLSFITVAMAAAPGFSPLLGSGLDHFFGWRSPFAFMTAFGAILGIAYAVAIRETHGGERTPITLTPILRGYGALLRDRRFVVPAASVSLVLGGLFAVFTVTPAILVGGLGFSPLELSLFYAGTVFVVFGAGFAAPRLAQRSSLAAVTRLGLTIASGGCVLMAALALAGFHTFGSYLLPMLVFLFGMGMLNPIGTALTRRRCVRVTRLHTDDRRRPGDHHGNDYGGIALSRIVNRAGDNDDGRGASLLLARVSAPRSGQCLASSFEVASLHAFNCFSGFEQTFTTGVLTG
jgi:MFS transporter, DHA1 family, multidrug resistance protein